MCDRCVSRRGFLGLVVAAGAAPSAVVEPLFRRRPSADGLKRVALTLDACPGGVDQRVLGAIVTERVKATIFLTARWMRRNPEGLALLLAHGDLFAFENHGARHVPAVLGTGSVFGLPVAGTLGEVRREVEDGAAAIKAATGVAPTWYRGAAGRYSPLAIAEIERMGFRIAAYSLSADLGASLPADAVARRMGQAGDGEVILGHVSQPRRPSGEGIAQGIVALRAAGVSFVGLGEAEPVAS